MNYRIAYITSKDPFDKKVSSGVYYYQSAALEKYCGKVYFLGPVNNVIINIIRKSINFLQIFFEKKYKHSHSVIISKIYGRVFSKKLGNGEFDLVFADKASCEIAHLKTNTPVIYSTDATFNLLQGYYPGFKKLSGISVREGNIIEQKAVNKSSLVICTTKWAASSVQNDYNYPSERIHVLPRGANLDRIPDREIVNKKRKTSVCRLLFIGKEFKRKGFDIVYKAKEYIRSRGVPVKLVVVGGVPPESFHDEDMEIIAYIDKNTENGINEFDRVMFNSDFLLLPTRAECMAIAICEAAAYGVPVITTDTGGISEGIKNGVNGYALKYDSDHTDYGEKIISIFSSDEKYYSLVRGSRSMFEKTMNWDVWGINFKRILDRSGILSQK